MVSSEHESESQDAQSPQPRQGAVPYHLASRFRGEHPAGQAYRQVRDLIYQSDYELSVYRFQVSRIFHVAVIGDTPPEPFEQRLRKVLAAGDPVELPPDVLQALYIRRSLATKQGSWVERRFHPGQPM